MTRALNKNKKPETNNKNRACNYFLGSFGSPCGFCDSKNLSNLPTLWLEACALQLISAVSYTIP